MRPTQEQIGAIQGLDRLNPTCIRPTNLQDVLVRQASYGLLYAAALSGMFWLTVALAYFVLLR